MIKGLYYGTENHQGRYLFDAIPGDLLGNIYEQYLGTILQGTEKRVKLDKESGKRKKMGIYYTPSYIVDYIVKNTVREYIKDKTIDEILEVRIVDPACGSGSFLIRAFKEVCDVIKEKLNKGEKGKDLSFKFYKDRLTLIQKSAILQRCVYGVDLDEKAVELAQLNLLLKLLEEETPETRRRILPLMKENIKCGNSLINDAKVAGDKAFNWHAQFKEVFAQGGFDVVVGNPPYGAKLKDEEKKHFYNSFNSAKGELDTFSLFIEKVIKLLRENGKLSFIIPNTLLTLDKFRELRKIILEDNTIVKIVNCGSSVFEEATVSTIILIIEKNKFRKNHLLQIEEFFSGLENKKTHEILQQKFISTNYSINLDTKQNDIELIEKIEMGTQILDNFCTIKQGVKTGDNQRFVIDKKEVSTLDESKLPLLKKLVKGKDISQYFLKWDNYLIYDIKEIAKLRGGSHRDNYKHLFLEPKLLIRDIVGYVGGLSATFDDESFFPLDTAYIINLKNKTLNLKYILALLNSKLLNYWFKKKSISIHVKASYIKPIPVHLPSPTQEKKIISLVNQMLELQKGYHDEKTAGNKKEKLKQQIDNVDYEIDEEVYKLYGITEEEKKIIEESLK